VISMLYCDVVTAASVGATAGTFDSIGTVTLRADARNLLGFWVEAALATSTAAEAFSGVIKVSSSDLGIGDQTFSCPPYSGGAPATNIGMSAVASEFFPMYRAVGGKTTISFSYSSNLPDPTGAASVVVGVIYEAGSGTIPADAMKNWPNMAPLSVGAVTQSKASITTVAATAVGSVTIPGWATEILGFKQYMVPNLMTAGEETVGYVEYTSTIPDFAPQKWPFAFAINAPLGTPVGQGANAFDPCVMGAWFQKSKQNETINANVYLNVAITTGSPIVSTVYYR
jgi:hypothetical protein